MQNEASPWEPPHSPNRRQFILNTGLLAITGLVALSIPEFISCSNNDKEDIDPPEDLMREHGILNRILLIYDYYIKGLTGKESMNLKPLNDSANIIRSFIEE